jgi:hypothetical protein
MAFTLDDNTLGVLAGGVHQTVAFDMNGEFRDVQFRFTQSGADQDAEVHYLEFHYTVTGVSGEVA